MRDGERTARHHAKTLRKEMTKAEVVLWQQLRALNRRGYKFRRQHPIGPFVADFVHIKGRLVIELDGATHGTEAEREYDENRTQYLKSQQWNVMRFWNDAIYRDVNGVVEQIVERLPLT